MHVMSAYEAKARFGQLLDTARNEPVMIEKHGRGVAVVISREEYESIQEMKLQQLQSEIQSGLEDLSEGRFETIDPGHAEEFTESVKSRARSRLEK